MLLDTESLEYYILLETGRDRKGKRKRLMSVTSKLPHVIISFQSLVEMLEGEVWTYQIYIFQYLPMRYVYYQAKYLLSVDDSHHICVREKRRRHPWRRELGWPGGGWRPAAGGVRGPSSRGALHQSRRGH